MTVRGTSSTVGEFQDEARTYDAILLMSFGGPEGEDDIIPFLENVLRGRNVPHERMLEVADHYRRFGGLSPINDQNRALIAALEKELQTNGPDLPVYWGNRNWHPFITDTLRQMRTDGVKRVLAFFTSAYSSYSGCRQYREDIMRAQDELGEDAPEVDRIRMFYNHPGFIEPNIENLCAALGQFSDDQRDNIHIAFTAHSVPMGMANNSDYQAQLTETSRLVAAGAGEANWSLVYQSRSGPPHQPWLEPDILVHLDALHEAGVRNVVIMPIGFISDHLEVLYDLDTAAVEKAAELGMQMVRAATVGTHPRFIRMIRELIVERMTANPERLYLGEGGPVHDVCPVNCCLLR